MLFAIDKSDVANSAAAFGIVCHGYPAANEVTPSEFQVLEGFSGVTIIKTAEFSVLVYFHCGKVQKSGGLV
jgi:hypothetical protein